MSAGQVFLSPYVEDITPYLKRPIRMLGISPAKNMQTSLLRSEPSLQGTFTASSILNKIKWLRKSKIPSKFHQKLNQLGKTQMVQIPVETVTKAIWQALLAQDDSTESRRVLKDVGHCGVTSCRICVGPV
jgi:hypothetical protein